MKAEKTLRCQECKKLDITVKRRMCGYQEEITGKEVEEIICDNCESEHLQDI